MLARVDVQHWVPVLNYDPSTSQAGSGRPPLLFVHGSYHAAWCWQVTRGRALTLEVGAVYYSENCYLPRLGECRNDGMDEDCEGEGAGVAGIGT